MRRKYFILMLIACFALLPVISSCETVHSYWGVEGEYGPHRSKHKKHHKKKHHKKHKHHHHHDDDDDD